ncbi:putative efflux protein, MATE family [Clostridium cavendishii DSM 21758]|uniref:Probable multidrug resistance protein NorM n=1 Tax=Clostridium cavendishii DSM 21758 TaxID=1121302 RepID=A0A1M6SF78_9CLOT|nr:MATE family efflux transporter [Clostridium cavendishii]SHK43393.1 putative efflux protein, MATE family [Clostridium cavendishii DSM 21758]
MKKDQQDLTIGSVTKKLIKFSIPLFIANLLQSFYSLVDMLVVGRVVGKVGLVAVSNASMISFIITSICIGITMGGTVLIAQYKGAGDEKGQKETIGTLFTISTIVSIIVTLIGLLVYKSVFELLNIPIDAMQDACDYMEIICAGTFFVFGYNAVCSIMKGFGDSKSSLYFVVIATIINVILDLILVGPLKLGTKGAAYATVFSEAVSFILSIIYLRRNSLIFDFKFKSFGIKLNKFFPILKIGMPTAIQMVIVNISYLLITGMLNNFGVSVAAASGIGLKVSTFAGMPCWAIGQSITAMVGQNMGAKNIGRVKSTTIVGLRLNLIITLLVAIFVQLFAEPIITLFNPASVDVVRDGVLYLRICCSLNSLIYATMYTFDSFAIGVGAANIAMFNALLDAVVVRLLMSWLLAFFLNYGFVGVYVGEAISPVLPAIVGLVYFKGKAWRTKKLIE